MRLSDGGAMLLILLALLTLIRFRGFNIIRRREAVLLRQSYSGSPTQEVVSHK
jgi:hypothetical protein